MFTTLQPRSSERKQPKHHGNKKTKTKTKKKSKQRKSSKTKTKKDEKNKTKQKRCENIKIARPQHQLESVKIINQQTARCELKRKERRLSCTDSMFKEGKEKKVEELREKKKEKQ